MKYNIKWTAMTECRALLVEELGIAGLRPHCLTFPFGLPGMGVNDRSEIGEFF